METIKVKNIHDIPNIEHLLNESFEFGSYSISDQIRSYKLEKDSICIEVCIISNENEILREELLSDLITQQDMFYFDITWYKSWYEMDNLVTDRIKSYQWNKNN